MSIRSRVRSFLIRAVSATGIVQEVMRPLVAPEGPIYRAGPGRPEIIQAEEPSWGFGFIGHYRRSDPAVTVKPYGMINDHAYLLTGGQHQIDCVTGWPFPDYPELDNVRSKGPIVICSDAMIGFQALIMSNVTVHPGAFVAARAVVTKDVPAYSIVGGVPAKVIGWRFEEPIREALLRIEWWDWGKAKIDAHRSQLLDSEDVAGFVARHDPQLAGRSCPDCRP